MWLFTAIHIIHCVLIRYEPEAWIIANVFVILYADNTALWAIPRDNAQSVEL